MSYRVLGGAGGVSAHLEELDALALALVDAAGDCAGLVRLVLADAARPGLPEDAVTDPWGLAGLVQHVSEATATLVRAGAELASLAAAVAATAAAYRLREAAVAGLVTAVPLVVGARLRVVVTDPLAPGPLRLAGAATGLAVVGVTAVRGDPGGLDLAVRALPVVLGAPDVTTSARALSAAGDRTGLLRETRVDVVALPGATGCVEPAHGVADLLRRGQSVASWRAPAPGGHDTLPPGEVRPVRGQVRVDRVQGPDGSLAWVVHVPGTQEWDGDGRGSPMDMAGNVALVGGADAAVVRGVTTALVRAGARPGQPVAVVGHSQGGMTALALASDARVRRVATVTHVITAGSPLAARTPPPGVQVLALEHEDDLVPRLDGRVHPDRPDRVTVRAPAPDGPWRADAVPAHSSSAYVVTAERVDASQHPSLVAYRASLAPFLARGGASCRSQQVVLTRTPGAQR